MRLRANGLGYRVWDSRFKNPSNALPKKPCFNQLSRQLGTPNKSTISGEVVNSRGVRPPLAVRTPPLATTPYRAHPSGRCVSCSIGSRTRPHPSQHRTSIEQRQGASRREQRCPCSACVRLHILRFFDLHLLTTRSPARPVGSGQPLKQTTWGTLATV